MECWILALLENLDRLYVLQPRPRPAVEQEQRNSVGIVGVMSDKVDVEAGDCRLEVVHLVHHLLPFLPVEFVLPVLER